MKPFPRANSSVSGDARTPTTGENDLTIRVRLSSLLSAAVDNGLLVADLPNRAIDKEDLPFGEFDLDKMPDNVLDLEPRTEGLAVRKDRLGIGVSKDSCLVGDRVFRTSSVGVVVSLLGSWPADPSPCEVMDYGSRGRYLAGCRLW